MSNKFTIFKVVWWNPFLYIILLIMLIISVGEGMFVGLEDYWHFLKELNESSEETTHSKND